jgi:hypothetical protein
VEPAPKPEVEHEFQRMRTLVLDIGFQPIEVVDWQRAITMDFTQKARPRRTPSTFHSHLSSHAQGEVLEYYDMCVKGGSDSYALPAVLKASSAPPPRRRLRTCLRVLRSSRRLCAPA